MKPLLLIALALPAFAQCPAGYTCTPIPQAVVPVVEQVAAATSNINYLPRWYASFGGGGIIPGHGGTFVYESISSYLGAQSYATTVQEVTLSKGKVQSCTMAGLAKVLYQFGKLSLGLTGLGGGCNSSAGSSGGAGAAQGFASFHLGKSGMSIVATGDKTFTTDGRQGVKLTLGVSYGK